MGIITRKYYCVGGTGAALDVDLMIDEKVLSVSYSHNDGVELYSVDLDRHQVGVLIDDLMEKYESMLNAEEDNDVGVKLS